MKIKRIHTKQNTSTGQAGRIRRIIAYAIDWYVCGMLAGLPLNLMYISCYGDELVQIPQLLSVFEGPLRYITGLLCLAASLFYLVFVPAKIWPGQTLGKKICGIVICDEKLQPADIKTLLIRQVLGALLLEGSVFTATNYLVQMISMGIGFNLMEFHNNLGLAVTAMSALLMLFGPKRKAFHDYLAKTQVCLKSAVTMPAGPDRIIRRPHSEQPVLHPLANSRSQ